MGFMEEVTLNHWAWFIIALALLGFEMMLPGIVFLWMAIAAAIVGGTVLFLPDIGWEKQLIIFSVLSLVSVLVARNFLKRNPIETEDTTLNKRGHQYVGHTYNLIRDMENGKSKVRIGDSNWSVEGDFEARENDKVKVVGVNITILIVEKA